MSRRALWVLTALALTSACGDQDPEPGSYLGSGGALATVGGAGGTAGIGGGYVGGAIGGGGTNTGGGFASGSGGTPPVGGFAGTGSNLPTGGTGLTGGGTTTGGTTTGGTGPTGGTIATGGAPPVNPYAAGFVPTTVTRDNALAAYNDWKTYHLENCNNGRYRVRWENAKQDATVSEGIGYGMLLTVSYDERAAFDGLLAYYKSALDDRGLMHWLRYGCDAHYAQTYSMYPDYAAADADLDVAMALIMANCRWGDPSYASEATRVVNAIKSQMFMQDGALRVLQPGDSEWFDELGLSCVNYSYFAPAYYRAFAELVPGDAAFWNGAANDAYTLLARASNASTGLVRNWGSASGTDAACNGYTSPSSYGDDAARTPWRIATDYLWYGTQSAKGWNDKVTNWVKTIGVSNTGQWYTLGGSLDTQVGGHADHTVITVGPWAVGSMTYDQATVDSFAAEILRIPSAAGTHDGEYYNRMLRALSLLTLSGGFTRCGGS